MSVCTGEYVACGYGIDPTGTNDSTSGLQTLINSLPSGATLRIPDAAVFKLTPDELTISEPLRVVGRGILSSAGNVKQAVLTIQADGCELNGLRFVNNYGGYPLQSVAGQQQAACLYINANESLVTGCLIDSFQSGIYIAAGGAQASQPTWGEWANHRIIGNRIKDVLGSGLGPTDTTSAGENGGDGIGTWGCQALIANNIINAIGQNWAASTSYNVGKRVVTWVNGMVYQCTTAGTSGASTPVWTSSATVGSTITDGTCVWTCIVQGGDARLGISAEGLQPYEGNQNPPHPDLLFSITGNVVYGKFRRSVAVESVGSCAITGNTLADATWWSIDFNEPGGSYGRGSQNVASSNTILWTRTSADDQGQAWSPTRTPLMHFGAMDSIISENTVMFAPGSAADAAAAFWVNGSNLPTNCQINDNTFNIDPTAAVKIGIYHTNSVRCASRSNKFRGPLIEYAAYMWYPTSPDLSDNEFCQGGSSAVTGGNAVLVINQSGVATVDRNKLIGYAPIAIQQTNGQGALAARDNVVQLVGASRTAADVQTFNGSTNIFSASAAFTSADGTVVPPGADIGSGLLISSVTNSTAAWVTNTKYTLGAYVIVGTGSSARIYVATTTGTSGGNAPSWPTTTGATVTDNGVTWTCLAAGTTVATLLQPATATASGLTYSIFQKGTNIINVWNSSYVTAINNMSNLTATTPVSGATNGVNGCIVVGNV